MSFQEFANCDQRCCWVDDEHDDDHVHRCKEKPVAIVQHNWVTGQSQITTCYEHSWALTGERNA